jgi:hypothetical protein
MPALQPAAASVQSLAGGGRSARCGRQRRVGRYTAAGGSLTGRVARPGWMCADRPQTLPRCNLHRTRLEVHGVRSTTSSAIPRSGRENARIIATRTPIARTPALLASAARTTNVTAPVSPAPRRVSAPTTTALVILDTFTARAASRTRASTAGTARPMMMAARWPRHRRTKFVVLRHPQRGGGAMDTGPCTRGTALLAGGNTNCHGDRRKVATTDMRSRKRSDRST